MSGLEYQVQFQVQLVFKETGAGSGSNPTIFEYLIRIHSIHSAESQEFE